ncbi:MAG: chorismate-binding protein [Bdellovibrionaceae bacterium]|nr:chorismate-binding protein [Pseudobdellovibrionaceae bacterium]
MALAGTSGLDGIDSTLRSPKNLEEHALVVKDISAVLAQFGQIQTGEVQTLRLQSLAHLQTQISVQLQKPLALQELISNLHPTPALGVAPRHRLEDLREMREGYGSFGAPFVVAHSPSKYVGLVGIRQLAWDKEYYYIRCGCGVVKESREDDEWQELLLKIQSVKKLFGWN